MNDARLFAVETRLQKEEEIRVEEFNYFKNMVKMLVFTMEQDTKNLKGKLLDGGSQQESLAKM